jgi:hypothetical protein
MEDMFNETVEPFYGTGTVPACQLKLCLLMKKKGYGSAASSNPTAHAAA